MLETSSIGAIVMTFSLGDASNPSRLGRATGHTRLRSIAGIVLAALLGACEDSSPSDAMGNGGPVEERFQPLARAMEQERVAAGVPGAAIAIVEGGEVTFARGFGTKSPEGGEAVEPSTLFRIGSCSKMLTAIAVLQTVADGQVAIERPVTDYVPDFHFTREGTTVEGITVRNLLTHTSGIVDAEAVTTNPEDSADEAMGQYIAGPFADSAYPMVPPSTFYNYANPNYLLLGRLAELVTQEPYRLLMQEKVFMPLGMERTFAASADVVADGDYALAKSGCSASDSSCATGPVVQPEFFDNAWLRPSGGIWSSVLDLAKVAKFLMHGDEAVLATEQWQAMTSAQVSTLDAGNLADYGYGVMLQHGVFLGSIDKFYAVEILGHGGATPGYATNIYCLKSQDTCMITLGSADAGQFGRSIATAFSTLVKLPAPSPAPDVAVHPERYTEYAGTYLDSFDIGEVRITTKAEKLYATVPQFDDDKTPYETELAPVQGDTFVFTAGGRQIPVTFIADESGQYKYIRSRSSVPIRSDATAGN
jgi:CubicO group peptidase (beta-lactamase class C family)